ncbi:low molecular weight phosphatase family protein [Candidatus Falkowbacteria bacterium CG10_big_fil_rev_8_21_14_0_10_39_11]|uniref:Low molecular weight phosphatase family protein n=1 Tax=Candidatus Falkowbacteria bacterium CG10_big_fil_rev_8_21_14_0_10_39_11 TaxID=1974565 RepID=A0A2H0V5H4_9BACT|nr:MAG: low molecular weight phosphatase family protein [Candidatus Falkowbacteria bacterium CG10_big_fil_rev_8_21_14_0_10_39_11]
MKVLFVCHGNVGRSQMAEAYFNFFTQSKRAISAGVDPTTPSRYSHPTKEIIQVMNEEQIDVSGQRVKLLNEEMVVGVDKIYVMCKKEQCPEFLREMLIVVYWDVVDPFKMDVVGTRLIRDQIKDKIVLLV